jgi:hypothetical protein
LKILDLNSKQKTLFLISVFFLVINVSYAQPALPERKITVQSTQPIDFGVFYDTGSGGTITVDYQGNRTTTGGITAISGSTVKPAIFEVKLCQGRNIIISYNPTTTLRNGVGPPLVLTIGSTEKGPSGSSFPVNNNCNFITTLRVGGTLNVPAGAAKGTYSGNFDLTFAQE